MLNPKSPLWMPYGSIRGIIALLFSAIVCVLALQGRISGQEFLTLAAMVAAFYFGGKSPTDPNATTTTVSTTTPPPVPNTLANDANGNG